MSFTLPTKNVVQVTDPVLEIQQKILLAKKERIRNLELKKELIKKRFYDK